MRTQSQTVAMYGFLIACILSAVSLFLPAYSIDFGSTGFTSASSDVYRIISSYYSWPVLVCAIGGIVVILAMYRRKLVLISGILQTVGLGYQLFNITRIQDQTKDSSSLMGTLSDMWANIGGGSGIEITLKAGFYVAFIAAALVAIFTALTVIMVEDQY